MNIEEAKGVIDNYFTHYIDENPELALAVSTVLSELEKKDRTIEQLKAEAKTYDRQAQQYFEWGMEKDNIINQMRERINELTNLPY